MVASTPSTVHDAGRRRRSRARRHEAADLPRRRRGRRRPAGRRRRPSGTWRRCRGTRGRGGRRRRWATVDLPDPAGPSMAIIVRGARARPWRRATYRSLPDGVIEGLEEAGERLGHARRVEDHGARDAQAEDGEAHRHPVVVVGLDPGRSRRRRRGRRRSRRAPPRRRRRTRRSSRTMAAMRSVSLRRMKPMPVTRVGPSAKAATTARVGAVSDRSAQVDGRRPAATRCRGPRCSRRRSRRRSPSGPGRRRSAGRPARCRRPRPCTRTRAAEHGGGGEEVRRRRGVGLDRAASTAR